MSYVLFHKLAERCRHRKVSAASQIVSKQRDIDQLRQNIAQLSQQNQTSMLAIKQSWQRLHLQPAVKPVQVYEVRLLESGVMRKILMTEAEIDSFESEREQAEAEIIALRQVLSNFSIKEKKMAIGEDRLRAASRRQPGR